MSTRPTYCASILATLAAFALLNAACSGSKDPSPIAAAPDSGTRGSDSEPVVEPRRSNARGDLTEIGNCRPHLGDDLIQCG